MKILIKNVHIIDPENNIDKTGDIFIENGVFADVQSADNDTTVLDGTGLTAVPGLVDLHVHLRDPGQTQKEDIILSSGWLGQVQ